MKLRIGLLLLFSLSACEKKPAQSVEAPLSASAQRGLKVYKTICISCHAADPKKSGAAGPEIAGSSRELLEARVLRAEYPPSYTPKRKTHQMPAQPHLKEEITPLYDYLNSLK